MTAWHDYQEQTADFFRSLGMVADVDERIKGARGTHAVDVTVRSSRAGIAQLWLVECKLWHRPVGKLHIAALAHIVQDVGADRGILLSEAGFQAGAITQAASSNITLSNLAELKERAADEADLAFIGAAALEFISSIGEKLRSKPGAAAADDARYNA